MDNLTTTSTWADRYGGLQRVFGGQASQILPNAHVAIIGIGGVGCWTAEALARSGIGKISLIDGDAVCVTNTNRQLIALQETVGFDKTAVMGKRIRSVNPECQVMEYPFYYSKKREEWLRSIEADLIVDAIDALSIKCALLHYCVQQHIAVITSGSGGGRVDPSLIRTGDLGEATRDPFLKYVRKKLRKEYGFSRETKTPFGIPCVYSLESIVYPWADGRICDTPEPGSSTAMDCNEGVGATAMVTGSMGLTLASLAIRILLKKSTILKFT